MLAIALSLLAPLLNFDSRFTKTSTPAEKPLEVYLDRRRDSIPDETSETESETTEPAVTERQVADLDGSKSEDVTTRTEEMKANDGPEPSRLEQSEVGEPPTANWYAAMEQVAQTTVDDHYTLQASRNETWRNSKTRSVVIQRGEQFVIQDDKSVVDDFEFVVRSRVFGIGFNIGRCFIGVPIAGVPVEDRTGDITVFVCVRGP
ncbi:MAG: hypothetical protein AAF417_19000 [Pseudomonadota bacterium]